LFSIIASAINFYYSTIPPLAQKSRRIPPKNLIKKPFGLSKIGVIIPAKQEVRK